MDLKRFYYEYKRRQRIKNPEIHDYCSYLLIGIMGPEWWIEHGFVRECPVPGLRIHTDFGHPSLKIAIEGDGRRWHNEPMDVLRDQRRDEALRGRGWYVIRFRYDELKYRGPRVRSRILELYKGFAGPTPEEIEITKRIMARSGFKV